MSRGHPLHFKQPFPQGVAQIVPTVSLIMRRLRGPMPWAWIGLALLPFIGGSGLMLLLAQPLLNKALPG